MKIKIPYLTWKVVYLDVPYQKLFVPFMNKFFVPIVNLYRRLRKLTLPVEFHGVHGFIEYDPKFISKRHTEARHWITDLPGYFSPLGDGKWVEGRTARREHLKRNNCREVDPSEWKPGYRNANFAKKRGLKLTEE